MARVRPVNTMPELAVRRIVYALGYRYRLHVGDLPGRPDLVLRKCRKVIFVHGCFWHRHSCLKGRSSPRNNADLWKAKFEVNRMRDKVHRRKLRAAGWKVLVIWECQLTGIGTIEKRIQRFLSNPSKSRFTLRGTKSPSP